MKKLILIVSFLFLAGNSYSQWIYQNCYDSITTISSGSFLNSNTGWYARSKGQISKTTDGGVTWNTNTIDANDLNSIKFVNASVGYVSGNNGRLLKTTNGGLNWSLQNSLSTDTLVSIDFINEFTGWCAGKDFIISTWNGGSQWFRQNVDTNTIKPRFTVLKMYDSQNGLAGAYNRQNFAGDYAYIYRTSNGGVNWHFVDSVWRYRIYSICYANQNIVYLSTYTYIYKSINGGIDWDFVSSLPGSGQSKNILQFKNENTGWIIRNYNVYRTDNGGLNWSTSLISNSYYHADINYTTNGNIYVSTPGGSVYKTTDEGDNWGNYSVNVESYLSGISILDANNIFVGGENGAVWKSTNGGVNWQNKFRDNIATITGPYFVNSNTGFLCSSYRYFYKSTNTGETWFKVGGMFSHDVHKLFCKDENNIWVVGDSGMIMKSTNSGNNWINKSMNILCNNYGITVNGNIIFVSAFGNADTTGGIYKSTNTGDDWIKLQLDSLYYSVGGYNIYFLNSNIGWIFSSTGQRFYKTTDGGNNWVKYYKNELSLPFGNWCFVNENTGYAVTDAYSCGIIKTTNSGVTWFENNPYANFMTFNIAFLNQNTGWVVGQSGLILKTTNGGTSFISVNNNNIPQKFSLSQNYPNPFNPTTNIKYQIAKNSFVTLKVYDILGKEIVTLVNEKLQPGEYEVQFPNVQVANVQLHSGVYFYKLTCGDYSETKKMLMIK